MFNLHLQQPDWFRTSYGKWESLEQSILDKYPLPNEPVFCGDCLGSIWNHSDLKGIAVIILDKIGISSIDRVKKLKCIGTCEGCERVCEMKYDYKEHQPKIYSL